MDKLRSWKQRGNGANMSPCPGVALNMDKLRGKGLPLLLLPFVVAAGGLLLVLLALSAKAVPLSLGQRESNTPAGEIMGSFTAGQTFVSPYPGLHRIDVVLATYGRSITGKATFNLATAPSGGTRLVSIEFDASQVVNNHVRSFEFSPIGDSSGKTYFFYLEAPDSLPGNAITAWTDSTNPYPEGMAYLEGRPVENDLTFVAYFRPNPWQTADVYLSRVARGKPGILGNQAFYAVAFAVYLGLTGTFLTLLAARALGRARP